MNSPRILSTTIAALLLALATSASATDGTWVGPGSGNYSDTTKWTGGTVAGETDAIATVNLGTSGSTMLTLNANITLGTLQATNSSGGDFNLIGNGTNILTFATTSGTPQLSLNTYAPAVIATDGTYQAVSVPYPAAMAGQPSAFFRVTITTP